MCPFVMARSLFSYLKYEENNRQKLMKAKKYKLERRIPDHLEWQV